MNVRNGPAQQSPLLAAGPFRSITPLAPTAQSLPESAITAETRTTAVEILEPGRQKRQSAASGTRPPARSSARGGGR
ncbi:hypothetical protein GCM10027591_06750 [Zhihengliuella somnathii]